MNKRNLIIGLCATAAVLVGSVAIYAGVKSRHDGESHAHGMKSGHAIERMVSKMDYRLDLRDAQKEQIREILTANRRVFTEARKTRREMRRQWRELDPGSSDYQVMAEQLADTLASQVRETTLAMTEVMQKIYDVLDEDQRDGARKILSQGLLLGGRRGHRRGHHEHHEQEDS